MAGNYFDQFDQSGNYFDRFDARPASVKAGEELNSIPRQLGLTARYGVEALGKGLEIGSEPLRYLTDRLTGQTGKTKPAGVLASELADAVGLPKPQGANERVIGDATRMGFEALGLSSASRAAGGMASDALQFVGERATPVAQAISQRLFQQLGQNQGAQVAAAGGAGLAGGSSREAGGTPGMQAGAALIGSVLGGLTPGGIGGGVNAVKTAFNKLTPQQLDAQITTILSRADVDYSQIPAAAQRALRNDLASALRAGQEVDAEAVRRLADFRTVGATPTRGMVSQNPVQITREQNLAKIGANSSDEGLSGLALLQNQNNATLIRNLNDQGATRGNLQAAGETVNGAILGRQAGLRATERSAWDAARSAPGYTQPIEANVISGINRALGEEGMMPFLNPTISRYMEAFQTGQQPFTPQAYRNLQSMLSNEMSKGGNEAAAAGIARTALMRSELRPITNPGGIDFGNIPITSDMATRLRALDAQPGQAIDAVNQARGATRAAYAYEDSSPLVRSVLSDGASGDPARIAKRFVVGGTANEAEMLAREVGDAGRGPIRDAILAHMKEKALNGATDEVGKFSQSAYNKAMREIGDRKLALFFSPEEIGQLRAVGRVASYAQVQPVGSAVNNSNSGALMVGKAYDAIKGVAGMIPGAGPVAAGLLDITLGNPTKSAAQWMAQRNAQKLLPGLLAPQEQVPMAQNLLLPGLAVGGLLTGP